MITAIRQQLGQFGRTRPRPDLASLIEEPAANPQKRARKGAEAIDTLSLNCPAPRLPSPTTSIAGCSCAPCTRCVRMDIRTLADLKAQVPRRRGWWVVVAKLGATGAKEIQAFFEAHPSNKDKSFLSRRPSGVGIVNEANQKLVGQLAAVKREHAHAIA